MYIIYFHMGVFVSDLVSVSSSPYRPEPQGEGRYELRGQIQGPLLNTTSKGLSGCRNGLKMLLYYNTIFIRSYLVHSTVKYCFIQTGLGFLSKTKFLANVALFF